MNGSYPYFRTASIGGIILLVGLVGLAFAGGAVAEENRSFVVEQGDSCWEVTPLETGESVVDFYGYQSPHSHTSTGIERSNVSNLFLFSEPGNLSVVVLHDKADDAHTPGSDVGGGAVSFDVSGNLSGVGEWVVRDDGLEAPFTDWAWSEQHTDGGAFRGGLMGEFSVTINASFNEDANKEPLSPGVIEEWHFLSGSAANPTRIQLDMDEPVTLRTGRCPVELVIDVKPGSDPNAVNPDSRGVTPVAVLNTSGVDPSDLDVSSLRFGAVDAVGSGGGAAPAHDGHREDVDGDGDADLVLHFPTPETGLERGDAVGRLVGSTRGGAPVHGNDSVKTVGRP